jgi:formylglycine-generating enzyme required for sulfatase activity/predicted Ser/Thr protein kinase
MLGHYELLEPIGQGGMAVVYKAVQPSLNRDVAIKVLPERFADSHEMVARFDREANIAAQLKHPNIIQIIDRGEDRGTLYIVMEYVEGESLADVIARGPVPLPEIVRCSLEICDALQYAHEKGVVHRDLKPSNVLLEARTGRTRIADFGIAQLQTDGRTMPHVTRESTSLGTMSYMSPEQRLDARSVTYHTDIFSFGVMLYEMLTGNVPIGHFKLPSLVRRDVPIGFDDIVSKCIAQAPTDRYQSAEEIRDAIAELAGRHTGLRGKKGGAGARRGSRARRALLAVGLLVVVAAAAVGLYLRRPWEQETPGPSREAGRRGAARTRPPALAAGRQSQGASEAAPSPDTGPAPGVGAADLLTAANAAFNVGDLSVARRAAERLRTAFPESDEAAQAEELIGRVSALQQERDLTALIARAQDALAGADPGEQEYARALALLDEAGRRFPDHSPRIAEEKQKVQAGRDSAYGAAVERGKAALANGLWEDATAAFRRAQRLRPGEEPERLLNDVKRRKELAAFNAAPDAKTRARHLALYLAMGEGGVEAKLLPRAQELRTLLEQLDEARTEAALFREKMDAPARSSLANGETDAAHAAQKLERLDVAALAEADLSALIADFRLALEDYGAAVNGAMGRLYPGLDSQWAAERIMAAYTARKDYPDSASAAAAYAEALPDEPLAAVAEALDEAARAGGPEQVSARLADVARQCERLGREGAGDAARSLRCLALRRRAKALTDAGHPLDAIKDAATAAQLEGANPAVGRALEAAADAYVAELHGLIARPAQAAALIRAAAPVLAAAEDTPVRERVAREAAEPDLAALLLTTPGLARVWHDSVGAFNPPGMVRVPAGVFPLGAEYTGLKTLTPSNAPLHNVSVGEFHIDAHEVTNEQFAAFVTAGGYADDDYWVDSVGVDRAGFVDATGEPGPRHWRGRRYPDGTGQHPVVGISWHEAAAYARWAGKRLPTEAEWECAATGMPGAGRAGHQKRQFPWGDSYVSGRANLADSGTGAPSPVGSWPEDKSPAGCFDMLGNVREWTASIFGPYPNSECQHSSFGKGMAVVRGRCFADAQIGAELTTRRAEDKGQRDANVGFRCAWSLPPH